MRKALALKLKLEEQSSAKVVGDRLELHRVFTNLIGNAIKFTEAGSIEVNLKPDSSWVVVEVKDTGPGITPEDQLVLFERFRPGSHKRSGSGLGLHLSRRIVEAHQGKIEVQSAIGQR